MTNEEAITIIRKEYLCVDRDCDIDRSCGKCDLMMPTKEPILEAYKMAIKALETIPKYKDAYGKGWDDGAKATYEHMKMCKDEQSGDLISRQAMLDGLASIAKVKARSDAQKSLMGRVMFFTEHLSPVTPQPKTGYWTRELIRNEKGGCIGAKMICSKCGNDNKHDEYMDYCPNCGTKMVEPLESEDKE